MEEAGKQMQKPRIFDFRFSVFDWPAWGRPAPRRAGARLAARRAPAALSLLLPLFIIHAAWAQSPAERAANAGQLLTLKNHRVLRLYGGEAKERGFAHGYLLAAEIRDDLDAALCSLPNFGAQRYERGLLPWAQRNFVWDSAAAAELEGLFEGLSEKLGPDGLRSRSLGRALGREDIVAINVLADYFGPACSGFAAWGKRSAGGEVIHARTLDFPIGPKVIADQIMVASAALPGRAAWVAIGWPGLIGQYTGMNSHGLTVCIHDAYNLKHGGSERDFMARGLLARRMLEAIDPHVSDPAEQGAKLAAAQPVACGDLFQLAWPRAAGEKLGGAPSAVLEFDPSDRKVDIRRGDPSGVLVLTNHFRVRTPPEKCSRFENMVDALETLQHSGTPIGLMEARKLLMAGEQPLAAHSVYFYPDKLELYVALTRGNVMSPRVAPVEFTWQELFAESKKEKVKSEK